MNKRVAAIIVTYNRKVKLRSCIEAVLAQCGADDIEIVVVDNNSRDDTAALFDALGPFFCNKRIHYYNTGANIGGAGGFCYGLRKAAELGCDYAWLMDDE